MPPDTKTLQINPALFSVGRAKAASRSSTVTRKKKEKPSFSTPPSTLRRKLIQKIKERQQREREPSSVIDVASARTDGSDNIGGRTMTDLSIREDSECEKSMQYMQDMMRQ